VDDAVVAAHNAAPPRAAGVEEEDEGWREQDRSR
jgi:hypothetical protein